MPSTFALPCFPPERRAYISDTTTEDAEPNDANDAGVRGTRGWRWQLTVAAPAADFHSLQGAIKHRPICQLPG